MLGIRILTKLNYEIISRTFILLIRPLDGFQKARVYILQCPIFSRYLLAYFSFLSMINTLKMFKNYYLISVDTQVKKEVPKNPIIESPEDLEKWLDDFLDG